jgi:hypothetical protein
MRIAAPTGPRSIENLRSRHARHDAVRVVNVPNLTLIAEFEEPLPLFDRRHHYSPLAHSAS